MTTPDDQPVPRDTRTPPHDLAAEMCVLGAMLLSKDAIADVVERVRSVDFYAAKHAWIFDAILDLYGRAEPADPVTVLAALTGKGHKVGGGPYMHDLVSSVPTAANGGYYASIVAKLALQRRLGEAATRIVQQSYTPGGVDVDDLVDQAQQAMYDITSHRAGQGYAMLGGLLQSTLDEVEAIGSRGDGPNGVPSGFHDLDAILHGAREGQLIIVAGRPGIGKSTLALDWARNATIRHGMPAAFFSLEMPSSELVMRVLSAEAKVPLNFIRSGQLSDDHWATLARRAGEIGEAPIAVDDSPNMTMMEIRAKARRMSQQLATDADRAAGRGGLKLIVVDYLQLMTASSGRKTPDRRQEVDEISRGLKLLAKELMCPVIAVAQLNREADKRADKVPQLSDLRESGSIENDADVVILVNRPDYYDKESPRAGEADFIIAKHRNGPTDTITVAAQLHFSRFVDMSIGVR